MKVENFRTKAFKDMVNTIAVRKDGEVLNRKGLMFNFNLRGETKPFNIRGRDTINDVVAYFYKQDGMIEYIDKGDIDQFERDVKLSDVLGEKVEIVEKKRKVKPTLPFNDIDVKEGDILGVRDLYGKFNIVVVKRTAKTFSYSVFLYGHLKPSNSNKLVRLEKNGRWSMSLQDKPYTEDELEKDREYQRYESMYR